MPERAGKSTGRPRRYDHYTRPEHRYAIRGFFNRNPELIPYFTQRWVDTLVSPVISREQVTPLFWALVHPASQERLVEALRYLAKQHSIRRVVSDLKSLDEDNVAAVLSELEMYRMLRVLHEDAQWKPGEGRGKRPADLVFGMREGRRVVVEVLAIRRSKKCREEDLALDEIQLFMDGLGHRYSIDYELKSSLSIRHVDACCAFLRDRLRRLGERRMGGESHADFVVGGKLVLRFRFKRTTEKGRWVAGMHDVTQREEGGRIKQKLFGKLDKFQLPRGGEELKGYVLVLDERSHDAEDVRSAVVGRMGVTVRKSGGEPEMVWIRQNDGDVHDPIRGRLLTEEVDFIASMTRSGGMFLKPLDMLVNGDLRRVTRDDACRLLWGSLP